MSITSTIGHGTTARGFQKVQPAEEMKKSLDAA
jgi:hypothetical protein